MSARSIRRAAERLLRKQAAKQAKLQNAVAPAEPIEVQPEGDIPEPGRPFPSLEEISPARLAANRANAQFSSGPRSTVGLATSSQNRTTHGLARHNGNFQFTAGEDPEAFEKFKQSLIDEHQPTTETESVLISTMAESHWLRNRAQGLQTACFCDKTGKVIDVKMFSIYARYENTHNRNFNKALDQLLKLHEARRKEELGFEAQRIKTEAHQMKKDIHYWNVLKKDAETCHQIGRNVAQKLEEMAKNPAFVDELAEELANFNLQKGEMNTATAA